MSEPASASEREAFRSFWDDGLLDVTVGLIVLVVGLSWWQHVAFIGAVFPAVCISLWSPLRKWLVEPRMGYVEFRGSRNLEVRSIRFGLMSFVTGVLLFGAVLALFRTRDSMPGADEWTAGFPLALVGLPVIFVAVFTNCRRFAAYALALLLAGAVVVMQGQDPHVGLMAGGSLITVTGLVVLARFLRRYPAGPPETS